MIFLSKIFFRTSNGTKLLFFQAKIELPTNITVTNSAKTLNAKELDHCKIKYMTVRNLENWMKQNPSAKHLLIFNNISIELFMFYVGLISNRLFEGALHFMYTYCQMLDERDVILGVQNIEYLRTYLKMFRRMFKSVVKNIIVGLNISVADNIDVNRLERNLTNMIDMTMLSKYEGNNDYQKTKTMQKTLETEYRLKPVNLTSTYRRATISVLKDNYLIGPMIHLYKLSNLFLTPKVNIYS